MGPSWGGLGPIFRLCTILGAILWPSRSTSINVKCHRRPTCHSSVAAHRMMAHPCDIQSTISESIGPRFPFHCHPGLGPKCSKSDEHALENDGFCYVGPSCSHLALIFHLGAIFGPSWAHLGAILGPCWAILGPSWGHLAANLGHLGPSWGHLGAILRSSSGLSITS